MQPIGVGCSKLTYIWSSQISPLLLEKTSSIHVLFYNISYYKQKETLDGPFKKTNVTHTSTKEPKQKEVKNHNWCMHACPYVQSGSCIKTHKESFSF